MSYPFFATLSRMKYIERWALMRNARPENVSEHSLEVGMIAHALCLIGNKRFGKTLNAERAALIGLYHDASEIITGDMPTPVKYYSGEIRDAYKKVEAIAEDRLLSGLPDDLREEYRPLFFGSEDPNEKYVRRLVKAADKISALIKCLEEAHAGNREFQTAEESTMAALNDFRDMPEVDAFLQDFLPDYGKTLDELMRG